MTKNYFVLGVLMFCFLKCTTLPSPPPTTALTKFSISEPEKFTNCYLSHQQPGAPTGKIPVVINLTTFYYDGTRKVPLDNQNLTVDPNTTPFPVTIDAKMPSDRNTPAAIEILVQGLKCSECANGYGSPVEPTQACNLMLVPNTNPQEYRAAIPQWSGTATQSTYAATKNLGVVPRMPNVSNSCGCIVK
jgi:hypothetical protein